MQNLMRPLNFTRKWPVWARYTTTTLIVFLVFYIRTLLFKDVGEYPFILFYPVIIATGAFFDRGNGIYATALAAALSLFYVLPYEASAADFEYATIVLVLFTFTGTIAAILVEALHTAYVELHDAHQKILVDAETRELLLIEIRHRTRNDLGVLTSMLSLQSMTLEGVSAKKALADAAERMMVLMRVQERLTVQAQAVVVDSKEYINDLCEDLRKALLSGLPIALNVNAESHKLNHQYAVAFGLMINELITNAIKYGFPDSMTGTIDVTFRQTDAHFCLQVEDDGVGMAASPDDKGHGLGLSLARTLASQLGGELQIVPVKKGARIDIIIPV